MCIRDRDEAERELGGWERAAEEQERAARRSARPRAAPQLAAFRERVATVLRERFREEQAIPLEELLAALNDTGAPFSAEEARAALQAMHDANQIMLDDGRYAGAQTRLTSTEMVYPI